MALEFYLKPIVQKQGWRIILLSNSEPRKTSGGGLTHPSWGLVKSYDDVSLFVPCFNIAMSGGEFVETVATIDD